MTRLTLWHLCATRGCLCFVPAAGMVCGWCEKSSVVRKVVELFATGRLRLVEPGMVAAQDETVRSDYALHCAFRADAPKPRA